MQRNLGINCPHCHSSSITRNGKKYDGKQNYRCAQCGRQFVDNQEKTYQGSLSGIDQIIEIMLARGISTRAVCTILKVSGTKVVKVRKGEIRGYVRAQEAVAARSKRTVRKFAPTD